MSVLGEVPNNRPLWTMLRSREEFGAEELPVLTVVSEFGVLVRDFSTGGRAVSADMSNYRVVRKGDLVVNRLWARFGAYGVSPTDGIISPAYWVLRVNRAVAEGRYLHHLLRSAPYKAEIGRISKDLPPNGFDLPWDQFRALPFPAVPLADQRRIADFLDDQITRIDQAIALRKRQVELLGAQEQSALDGEIERQMDLFGAIPLRRWITSIEQGWSPSCSNEPAGEDEFGVLKLSAVRAGHFFPERNKEMIEGTEPQPRYALRAGDLLISRANTPELVGEAAVVDRDYPNLFLCDLLYRVSVSIEETPYIAESLRSSRTRGLLRVLGRGTSQTMVKIRGDDIRGLLVPNVDGPTRIATSVESARRMAFTDRVRETIRASNDLVEERKRSLITAAVTGELDLSTLSARASQVVLDKTGV